MESTGVNISDVLGAISTVYTTLLTFFGNVVNTITGNALFYVPILIAFVVALVRIAIRVAKKLGLRGVKQR